MKLKKFDSKSIDAYSTVMLVGARRSGKSYYMKWLVEKIKSKYSLIIVFTQTKVNEFWNDITDSKYIYDKWNPSVIEKVYKRNEKIDKELDKINPNTLIILDDMADDTNLRTDNTFMSLFVRGRHHKCGVLMSTQYINLLSPTIRNNLDIIVIPIQRNKKNVDLLYDFYGSLVDKDEFYKILKNYTKDYGVLVIRNDLHSNDVNEIFLSSKAE
jgi:hypothetical protein